MKLLPSLYTLELKKHRSLFVKILALQLVSLVFLLFVRISQFYNNNSLDPFNILPISSILLEGTFFLLPFLLLYSWHHEEKGNTHYQGLSYPVRSHDSIKNKLKAFLSIGAVAAFLLTAYKYVMMPQPFRDKLVFMRLIQIYLGLFSRFFLLLGFVCLVIGALQVIRQRRLLIGAGLIMAGPALYLMEVGVFRNILFHQIHAIDTFFEFMRAHQELATILLNSLDSGILILLGTACMYAGFYLFDKYSEV